jgi:hypothetical protein
VETHCLDRRGRGKLWLLKENIWICGLVLILSWIVGYLLERHCCFAETDTNLLTCFRWTILAGGREY